ncbi:tetratricopeptide tpr-2 repeat protein [Leptolyngbya sp. Heron Island J]|uniref:tetratricopeptide repeat protein n=1 Tax=Leptolyngbya sp. Heron Island J TaxID=1385935 RepID=UPI0003B978BB|nr:tetratricopeptide repeat protein [Leptolyngbya sp. Heron Island J]ESA36255.1 tetratricopeptide tpr-2 repeat protein [Leptolyngbya sp. Heron Island J]
MAKQTKKKKKQAGFSRGFGNQSLTTELAHAKALIRREQWTDAHSLLTRLKSSHPKDLDVLTHLLEVYDEMGQLHRHQATCEEFLAIKPNDARVNFLLGYAYMLNYYPLLGVQQYRYAIERWPDYESSAEAKEHLAMIEPNLPVVLEELGLSYPDDWDLGILHEQTRAYTTTGQAQKAIDTAQSLIQQRPDFVHAYNSLAWAYVANNQYETAIATFQTALEQHPESISLRADLIQCFCFRGNFAAAEPHKAPLLANSSLDPDEMTRQAKALAYLDDMAGILNLLASVPPVPEKNNQPVVSGLFHHLVAVALVRQGDLATARKHWQLALELSPDMAIAKENLDDFDMTPTFKEGPWPFELNSWVATSVYQDLRQVAFALTPDRTPQPALVTAVNTLLETHPFISQLVPVWLKRGSPRARMLAIAIAKSHPNAEHLAALNTFAGSTHGSESQRYHIASYLDRHQQLTITQLWLNGKWQERLPLANYEIVPEPAAVQSSDTQALLDKALKKIALESPKAAETAEAYLQQALAIEPHNPILLNNLALAYTHQERLTESRQLTQQIIDEYPEDVDSRIALTQLYLQEENLDAAETVLNQLLQQSSFTEDSLVSLMLTRSRLLMLQGQEDMARLWFQEVLPMVKEHPLLRQLGFGQR